MRAVHSPDPFLTRWLRRASPAAFAAYCIAAAFGTYFCMYAFRKPWSAATFEGQQLLGLGLKEVLVASQLVGYTASKFIGLRFVSALDPARRARVLLALIAAAELALLGFALAPVPLAPLFLVLNGLPLGMVFGLVLGFLEGRRMTEALTAGLCASFIFASGAVKSVGRGLIVEHGVGERWMPFATGALFAPLLLLCVWMLTRIPPPTEEDERDRHERVPMDAAARRRVFRTHRVVLLSLCVVYALITVVRTIRDDFAVELWAELGVSDRPSIFARSELAVMVLVTLLNGAAFLIRDHGRAFRIAVLTVPAGFALVIGSVLAQRAGSFGAFPFMVAVGFGMYVPYVAFHTTVFERFLASVRERGNLSYPLYLADSAGYLAALLLLFGRGGIEPVAERARYLPLFTNLCVLTGVAASLLAIAVLIARRRATASP